MAYWEWGDAANPRVLVCVHGLSRQGRDFDALARALCGEFRVVCPDVVGRGQSDWLADPAGYQVPAYVADMVTLLARLDAHELHWLGTSMGGLIGLGIASLAGSPIASLVLNDIGPAIRYEALVRIGTYLGMPVRWTSVPEAADYLLSISKGFGPHSPQQWLALTRPMLKEIEDERGRGFVPHYDPAIALAFGKLTPAVVAAGEAATWAAYDSVSCPVLLLHGADSDVLSREAALAMTQRGPKARLREFAGIGHAPTLIAPDQIAAVREFLLPP
jgi:pimeloyl-ACP methyl ester carboxylesterase